MNDKVVAIKHHKPLTEIEERFVFNVAVAGMSDAAAARHAGAKGTGAGSDLSTRPHVIAAIRAQKQTNARKMEMTRDKIIEGLAEAIEHAKLYAEPASEIAGWREIAKITGFYDAPVKKKELSEKQERFLQLIQEMDEGDIINMLAKDVGGNVIDADSTPETD